MYTAVASPTFTVQEITIDGQLVLAFVRTIYIAAASPTSMVQDNYYWWTTPVDVVFKQCTIAIDGQLVLAFVQTMFIVVASPTSMVQDNSYWWTTPVDVLFKRCMLLLLSRHIVFRTIAIDRLTFSGILFTHCISLLLSRHILSPTGYIDRHRFLSTMIYNGHWQTLFRGCCSSNALRVFPFYYAGYMHNIQHVSHDASRLLPKAIQIDCERCPSMPIASHNN